MVPAIFLWLIAPREAFIGSRPRWKAKMTTRVKRQIAASHGHALTAFVAKKVEIDAMLARLQALSDDHFNYSPDEITWDHVGTLGYYAELLKRVTDSAFREGECAD
jgi:hypothetical protein